MSHHHDHDGSRSDDAVLSFEEKAHKLLEHWIRHNTDHAENFRQWAQEFQKNDLAPVATLLISAADLTLQINLALQQALSQLDANPSDV